MYRVGGTRATDWAALAHAYGSAGEVPDLLDAIAAGVEPAAGDAVGELFALLYHQGSTYPATDAALPYLVDLAVDGPAAHRAAIVTFLGQLAREDGTHPLVGRHADRMSTLLADPDPRVRQAAVWLLAEYERAAVFAD